MRRIHTQCRGWVQGHLASVRVHQGHRHPHEAHGPVWGQGLGVIRVWPAVFVSLKQVQVGCVKGGLCTGMVAPVRSMGTMALALTTHLSLPGVSLPPSVSAGTSREPCKRDCTAGPGWAQLPGCPQGVSPAGAATGTGRVGTSALSRLMPYREESLTQESGQEGLSDGHRQLPLQPSA